MRPAPCGYSSARPRRSEKPPLRRGGDRSPKAIKGEKFFKLPQTLLRSASPLFVEEAFGDAQTNAPAHRAGA